MSSRRDMLERIRRAVGANQASPVPREYVRFGTLTRAQLLELLVDRLVDYKATVQHVEAAQLAEAIDRALGPARSVVVPPGLEPELAATAAASGRMVVVDTEPEVLDADRLDAIDAVLTRARVAIAISGTIVLDGSADQGRRMITLVPDRHVIVLDAEQVVETVPEGLGRLHPTSPLTLIAGPSATSDIELSRVEGVHGPRTLEVILVGG